MIRLIRLLLSFDLTATACEQLLPATHTILPLGGSPLAQFGVILVAVVVYIELHEMLPKGGADEEK